MKRKRIETFLLACCMCVSILYTAVPVAAQTAQTIFVANDGNDNAAGTMQEPLQSLEGARDKIREIKNASGLPTGGITVNIRGGEYKRVKNSFDLNSQDSGAEGSPIIYQAYNGEQVSFTGNLVLPGAKFSPVSDESIKERLPQAAQDSVLQYNIKDFNGITEFSEITKNGYGWPDAAPAINVLVDGEAQTLSRYPNSGFVRINSVQKKGFVPRDHLSNVDGTCPQCTKDGNGTSQLCKFGAEADWVKLEGGEWTSNNIDMKNKVSLWKQENDPWASGYFRWDWADDNFGISAIDETTNGIKFKGKQPSFYGVATGTKGYYAFNLLCEIDQPGEWYLDRQSGILYIYPKKDISASDVELTMMTNSFVKVNDAEHIQFKGLTFAKGNSNGIQMEGSSNMLVAACNFQDLGQRGVTTAKVEKSPKNYNEGGNGGANNLITGSNFLRTGQGGVYLGGGNRYKLTPGNNVVKNCNFDDFATIKRTYAPAVMVIGSGNSVLRNRIVNGPHIAIAYEGNDITIEGNEIANVCYETADSGAIYTCRTWSYHGVKINNNFLHDITSNDGLGSAAVYLDDMMSGTEVKNNLFVNIPGWTALIGGGRDNVFENNITLNKNVGKGLQYDNRGLGWAWYHGIISNGWLYNELMFLQNHDDYDAELWKQKYPALANIPLKDRAQKSYNGVLETWLPNAMRPAGASIQKNIFVGDNVGTGAVANEVKTDGVVQDNQKLPMNTDIGFYNPDFYDFRVKKDSEIKKLMGDEHFNADVVGIYVDEYRPVVGKDVGEVELAFPQDKNEDTPFANGAKFRWNTATNADSYLLEIAKDNTFENTVVAQATSDTTIVVGSGLEKSTEYFWRVTAVEKRIGGSRITSEVRSFTTAANEIEALFEGFGDENLLGWTAEKGNASITDKNAHSGNFSFVTDESADYISKDFGQIRTDEVSIWVYDDLSKKEMTTGIVNVALKTDGKVIWNSVGIRSRAAPNGSHDYYTMRNPGTSDKFSATSVSRTEGWHEFKWTYADGKVKTKIDDTVVYETETQGFNYIAMGDSWVDGNHAGEISNISFDDLRIGEPIIKPEIISVSLNQSEISLVIGEETQLEARVITDPDTDVVLDWSSSSHENAFVDENGKVLAHREGETEIKVYVENNAEIFATCKIIITKAPELEILTPTLTAIDSGVILSAMTGEENDTFYYKTTATTDEMNKPELGSEKLDGYTKFSENTNISGVNGTAIYVQVIRVAGKGIAAWGEGTATPTVAPTTFNVTVNGGTSSKESASQGDSVTVTANEPEAGMRFTLWTVEGVSIEDLSTKVITFTMPASSVTFIANYEAIPTFSITVNPAITNGTISVDKVQSAQGETITVSVQPNDGYMLKENSLACNGAESPVLITGNSFVMPGENVTVTAEFEKLPESTYSITINSGANGAVTADKTHAAQGAEIVLTVTPEEGYKLVDGSLKANAGAVEITENKFIMPAQGVTITSTFEKVVVSVDKTPLEEKLSSARAIAADAYTAESFAILQQAIIEAQAAYDAAMTQDDITAATAKLQTAIEGLVKKPEPPTPTPDPVPEPTPPAKQEPTPTPTPKPIPPKKQEQEVTAKGDIPAVAIIDENVSNVKNPVFEIKEISINSKETEKLIAATQNEVLQVMELSLYSDGAKISQVLGGKISVELTFNGEDGKAYVVLRYNDDGSITEIEATYKDGKIFFDTDHFSLYAIALKAEAPKAEVKPPVVSAPIEKQDNTSNTVDGQETPQKTSAWPFIALFVVIIAASGIVGVIIVKKRNQQ